MEEIKDGLGGKTSISELQNFKLRFSELNRFLFRNRLTNPDMRVLSFAVFPKEIIDGLDGLKLELLITN